MAKKTEQMSVRLEPYVKSMINVSDLSLNEIIKKGLQADRAEKAHEDSIKKFKEVDHRFNFYDHGMMYGRKMIKPIFAKDESVRQEALIQLQDSLEYKGLQEVEGSSCFRIIYNHEYQYSMSEIISIFFYSLKEGTPIQVKYREDKFVLKKLVIEFDYQDPMPIPPIEVYLTQENLKKYEKFVFSLCEIIDELGMNIQLGILWCDHYYEDDVGKEVTRGNLTSWRNEVIKEGECACCGGDKYLEAHHIFSYNSYPDLRDDVSNGVALCKWCHKKLHSYYGKEPSPVDLANFFNRFAINREGSNAN